MKTCKKCQQIKDDSEFYKGLTCKACHIQNVRKNDIEYGKQRRAIITEYLRTHPCVDCGITDIRVLDFDHVRGEKKYNIAHMIRGYAVETLLAEIAKCDVRCANCHRIVTGERAGWHNAIA